MIFDIPPAFRTIKEARRERFGSCGIFNILGLLGDGRISICGIGSVADSLVLGRIKIYRLSDIQRFVGALHRAGARDRVDRVYLDR